MDLWLGVLWYRPAGAMVRVAVVVTARPSYARLRSVLLALQAMPDVELQIIVGCSALLARYGAVVDVIRADGLPVSAEVWATLEGETLLTSALSTGYATAEFANVFVRLHPDLVVIHADRHELLAPATAARLLELPIAHLQGGEVTGSVDDTVRNTLTQLATYHLVSTAQAARRVLAMRLSHFGGGVYVTGCPSLDLCVGLEHEPPVSVEELGGAGAPLDLSEPFCVLLQHPTTEAYRRSHDEAIASLNALQGLGMGVLVFWPGNEAGMDGASKAIREAQGWAHTVRNLPPRRFLKLLTQAGALVGNSSVGIREGSYLGVPVVNIGTRQRGRERAGNVLDVQQFDMRAIQWAIEQQLAHGRYPSAGLYGDGQSGPRVAEVLAHECVGHRAGAVRV